MATLKEILTKQPVAGFTRLTLPAGAATPQSGLSKKGASKAKIPLAQALSQYRINLMGFCKEFNARTQKYKRDTPLAVKFTAFTDNTYEFEVRTPSVNWYLKQAAGIETGMGMPGHWDASDWALSLKHVYEIAKVKQSDPYCQYMSLESICKSIIGTANSMGIKIVRELK